MGYPHPRLGTPGNARLAGPRSGCRKRRRGPSGGSRKTACPGGSDQPAIHVRDDRPAQRRRVESPQPAVERVLCGRRSAARRARPDLHSGAVIPLFRLRAGHDVRRGERGGDGLSARDLRRRRHAGGRRGRALHGHLRRADHVYRRAGTPGLPAPRSLLAADGHHGGQPLPGGTHEARHPRHGRPRNHHRLRSDGGLAADHHDPHRRSDR